MTPVVEKGSWVLLSLLELVFIGDVKRWLIYNFSETVWNLLLLAG